MIFGINAGSRSLQEAHEDEHEARRPAEELHGHFQLCRRCNLLICEGCIRVAVAPICKSADPSAST